MKKLLLILLFASSFSTSYAQPEVIYHVFQRSFFDSNGDGQGDLTGMRQKLDYLQNLGVTSILLTPLYVSDFYHNYFATDFEKIDPAYGSMQDYLLLVKEVHRRKMKIYQDVEMQYVTGKHHWFTDSYKNPASPFSKYIYYEDAQNQQPYWFYGVSEFTTYNNSKQQIAVVNMKNPAVKQYTLDVLRHWVDPNGDGRFDDGVDGFRLDHMMDDLDYSGKLTHLFSDFWAPLLTELRRKNPALQIVAEQANWGSFGYDYISEGKVDRVFAFRLKHAIESFDKKKIMFAADSTFGPGKQQVVFIENHDTKRFATTVNQDPGKLRAGAAMNILIGGIPSIYYGQELGMTGAQLKGMTDGNDIPIREAFEWYRADTGKGMAFWYKNTGPWWDSSQVKPNDGISVEEQQKDPNSLLNYYKELLHLRKTYPALNTGRYQPIPNNNDQVYSFLRYTPNQKILLLINLSPTDQSAEINMTTPFKQTKKLFGTSTPTQTQQQIKTRLSPYECLVLLLH
ncbi:MAG: alpha-amylase family glycosyl hydrolase [Chitinophagaceae bacterium]